MHDTMRGALSCQHRTVRISMASDTFFHLPSTSLLIRPCMCISRFCTCITAYVYIYICACVYIYICMHIHTCIVDEFEFASNRAQTVSSMSDQIPVWLKPATGKVLSCVHMDIQTYIRTHTHTWRCYVWPSGPYNRASFYRSIYYPLICLPVYLFIYMAGNSSRAVGQPRERCRTTACAFEAVAGIFMAAVVLKCE